MAQDKQHTGVSKDISSNPSQKFGETSITGIDGNVEVVVSSTIIAFEMSLDILADDHKVNNWIKMQTAAKQGVRSIMAIKGTVHSLINSCVVGLGSTPNVSIKVPEEIFQNPENFDAYIKKFVSIAKEKQASPAHSISTTSSVTTTSVTDQSQLSPEVVKKILEKCGLTLKEAKTLSEKEFEEKLKDSVPPKDLRSITGISANEVQQITNSIIAGQLTQFFVLQRSEPTVEKLDILKLKDQFYKRLIKNLADRNPAIKVRATKALGNLSDTNREILEALFKNLIDIMNPDLEIKRSAAEALEKLGRTSEKIVKPLLFKKLSDANSNINQCAAEILINLEQADKEIVEVLIKNLSDTNSSISQRATQALKKLRKSNLDEVISVYKKNLAHDNVNIRQYAAEALIELGQTDKGIVEVLRKNLNDMSSNINQRAAETLILFVSKYELGSTATPAMAPTYAPFLSPSSPTLQPTRIRRHIKTPTSSARLEGQEGQGLLLEEEARRRARAMSDSANTTKSLDQVGGNNKKPAVPTISKPLGNSPLSSQLSPSSIPTTVKATTSRNFFHKFSMIEIKRLLSKKATISLDSRDNQEIVRVTFENSKDVKKFQEELLKRGIAHLSPSEQSCPRKPDDSKEEDTYTITLTSAEYNDIKGDQEAYAKLVTMQGSSAHLALSFYESPISQNTLSASNNAHPVTTTTTNTTGTTTTSTTTATTTSTTTISNRISKRVDANWASDAHIKTVRRRIAFIIN